MKKHTEARLEYAIVDEHAGSAARYYELPLSRQAALLLANSHRTRENQASSMEP